MMNIDKLKASELASVFKRMLADNETRKIGDSTCVELQNINFIADQDWIIRQPNYEYATREIEWYTSQSLYVDDIPGKVPQIWKAVADKDGKINSNYGWCIFSNENGNQYRNCLNALVNDPHTRQAVMIYNRPSMHTDAYSNGMHDFMCTFSTQCFLNDMDGNNYKLKYIVNQRSQDAVFGYNNDILWHQYVQDKLSEDLSKRLDKNVWTESIECNVGSLHVYERHFKYIEN